MKLRLYLYRLSGKCVCIHFFLFLVLVGNSQSSNYQFRFIGLPENFRSQYISILDEDAAGMLWFVTNNGLHRYDGNQVLTFDMQSKPSLPDININHLFADSHSNLWIATSKKLVRFNLKAWTTTVMSYPDTLFANYRDAMITSIAEAKDGTVYFGSGKGKLFSYTSNRLRFITEVHPLNNGNNEPSPAISTISETSTGQLWLATEKGQVVHVFPAQQKPPVYYEVGEFQKTGISFLAFGNSGKCLLYADETGAFLLDTVSYAVSRLEPPQGQAPLQFGINHPVALEGDEVAFFSSGPTQNLNSFSVYNFGDESFKNLNSIYPATFKNSIFRKVAYKKQKIYISTDRGIGTINHINNPFHNSLTDLENINSIRTIYKQDDGNLLIGSYKENFIQLNEPSNKTRSLSGTMISCLLPWGKDSMLAGTEGKFPMWYFPSSNKFKPVLKKENSDKQAIDKYVLCFLKENDTLVWAGTYVGCYLFNPVKGTIIKREWTGSSNAMQRQNVTDILKVENKRYFATYEGIYTYNITTGTGNRLFAATDSSYAKAPYYCLRLVGNEIWAGSGGNGIIVFDTFGNIKKHITVADGLASNIVFSLPVCKKYVLAGTSKGLSIINQTTGSIRNYSSQRYLPSNEFNRSAWFVKKDTVYMGTTNGFMRFTVAEVEQQERKASAPLRFSSFSLNNGNETKIDYTVAYATDTLLVIPSGTKSFSISFGGLGDATDELNLYYRFGSDSTWQNIGQRREVTFVNIPPGKYILQIAGSLPDGQRTGNLLTIPLDVRPLFYQTIWFKIILLLIVIAMIWWGIKYREKSLRKEQQLRSQIAADLHDEVGSALTRIYFQAEMLSATKDDIKDTSLQKLPLQRIVTSSQEAMSSMSDMVWSIDAHYDNASDMVGRMKDYLMRLQDEFECTCQLEVTGDYGKRHITQLSRQNIFLIFKEAVTNALKYGLDKTVITRIDFEKNQLVLTVKNTKGLPENTTNLSQGGHGLKNMQLRANKINATISILDDGQFFRVLLSLKA